VWRCFDQATTPATLKGSASAGWLHQIERLAPKARHQIKPGVLRTHEGIAVAESTAVAMGMLARLGSRDRGGARGTAPGD
jgi:hypothetical protein